MAEGKIKKMFEKHLKKRYDCVARELIRVSDEHVDIQSRPAYILLIRKLAKKDDDRYDFKRWIKVRKRYLNKILLQYGRLWCEYCGHSGLLIQTQNNNELATIDHFTAVSNGGKLYDEKNFKVCCYKCNQEFGTVSHRDKIVQYPV